KRTLDETPDAGKCGDLGRETRVRVHAGRHDPSLSVQQSRRPESRQDRLSLLRRQTMRADHTFGTFAAASDEGAIGADRVGQQLENLVERVEWIARTA